jgi:hypothetical protein
MALPQSHRGVGQRLGGPRHAPAEEPAGRERQQREYEGGQQQAPHQRADSLVGLARGRARLDERDALAARREHREARGIQAQRADALHGETAVGQRLRMQRGEFVVRGGVELAVVDEPHRQARMVGQQPGEVRVQQVHHGDAERGVLRG